MSRLLSRLRALSDTCLYRIVCMVCWEPFQAALLRLDVWYYYLKHFAQAMLSPAHSPYTTCLLDSLLLLHGSVLMQCKRFHSTDRWKHIGSNMSAWQDVIAWQHFGRSHRNSSQPSRLRMQQTAATCCADTWLQDL